MNNRQTLDKALIIFLKYPQAGLVKTRLGKEIGLKRAATIYRLFIETILANTAGADFKSFIFYSPADKSREIKEWLGGNSEMIPQKGQDLGQRMLNAFKYVFDKGLTKVVIIGTDSPLVNKEIIEEAFRRLDQASVVIGPCLDGGYYLLGLTAVYRELFDGLDWSSSKVLSQTKEVLKKLSVEYSFLENSFDVDDVESLALLQHNLTRLKKGNTVLRNLSKWLERVYPNKNKICT